MNLNAQKGRAPAYERGLVDFIYLRNMKKPTPTVEPTAIAPEGARLVRLHEILSHYLPLSRSRFYELIAAGDLPPGIPIGPAAVAWRLDDIRAYLARCQASLNARQQGTKLRRGPPPTAPARLALLEARRKSACKAIAVGDSQATAAAQTLRKTTASSATV
ncbi:AlpA family phage regulatory protein [Variovorax sp. J31P179]|uniref:helix-turn-helix transcriptional regulator n=1 Tax=Variovorax sp. J31P179 TaxID=3053508 RepID=UPI0025753870|nr:AlpA family phage regulatory protein [Variovorax sp. J31P179]MDM0083154.1 AlpA family phage regulatory protein [Variovorax sp. J31P179]